MHTTTPQVGVVRVDWPRWASFLPAVATAPRYRALFRATTSDGERDKEDVRDAIFRAAPEARLALVTEELREQIARVLRTPAAKLDSALPLSELGIDSLMAFELVNRIESQFRLSLPPSKLNAGATIARLAEVLLEVMAAVPGSHSGNGVAARATEAVPASHGTPIVTFHEDGMRAPLFCIHPAGGLANIYNALIAALPDDRPVYAIQSRALAPGLREHETLAALTSDYASQIVDRQPSGAYRLAGFSLGGAFALAVARELEARGASVAILAVIDSDLSLAASVARSEAYVRRHVRDMYETFSREFALVRAIGNGVLEDEAAELAARVLEAAPQARPRAIVGWLTERGRLNGGISPRLVERYFELFDAHLALLEGFVPPVIQAPIFLWHRGPTDGGPDLAAAWRDRSRSAFEARVLDGSHYDLMYPPRVAAIAADLDEALRRGESSAGVGTERERRPSL
jgi:thioesterase domain-containing protein/acyl carrier protein